VSILQSSSAQQKEFESVLLFFLSWQLQPSGGKPAQLKEPTDLAKRLGAAENICCAVTKTAQRGLGQRFAIVD